MMPATTTYSGFVLMRFMRPASFFVMTALLSSTALPSISLAADTKAAPAASAPAAAEPKPADPNALVATVNGDKITVADVQEAVQTMPPQLRKLPENMILPMLVKQLVDQKTIQILAYKEKLNDNPEIKAAMQRAADNALQNEWLSRQVTPMLTDAAIEEVYKKEYTSKPAEEEVHARHILVKTQAEAEDIIKKLKGGADFGTLATKLSTDTGSAKQNGGDLGWFKKGDMIPAFSDAAFKMKPGTYSETPVQSKYGWHVIQVLEKRQAAVPTLDEVKDKIRQQLIQEDIRKVLTKAEGEVKIVRYNPSTGKPIPDAPAAPAAPAPAAKK